jgi:hypothetical protein
MYTFEQLKEDVRKEAQALRVHATKEERERIIFDDFSTYGRHSCIYGLATTDCHSQRAAELICKCTPRYFRNDLFSDIRHEGFKGVANRVNGKRVKDFVTLRTIGSVTKRHFSAIEAYILLPEADNANLIAFLRGETETLEL